MSHPLAHSRRRALVAAGGVGLTLALTLALLPPASSTATLVTCQGHTPTLTVTDPNEVFLGTPGPDVIQGSSGDDSIRGLGGADIICGYLGDDHLNGGKGHDELYGESGGDLLRGRRGQDFLDGDGFTSGKRGFSFDRCRGGVPTPDTAEKGDVAVNCERVFSAFHTEKKTT